MEGCAERVEAGGTHMKRKDPLSSGELTFMSSAKSSAPDLQCVVSGRSVFRANLRSGEVAIGSSRGKRHGRAREHTKAAGALRAHHLVTSSDFALLSLCTDRQVYVCGKVPSSHRGSCVDQEQCRARSQSARAQQGRSASFSGQPARARQHADASEASGGRSTAYGARAAGRTRFT